jgi:hypothetical protein
LFVLREARVDSDSGVVKLSASPFSGKSIAADSQTQADSSVLIRPWDGVSPVSEWATDHPKA